MSRAISRSIAALALAFALSGCIARTVLDVATAPVRVAGKAVDLATTSQFESDEKRGRALRQREARLGQLERDYARNLRRCREGRDEACDTAEDEYREMQRITPTLPVERDW